jgi:pimeloyl-ACP methyl ester carboxylesterase
MPELDGVVHRHVEAAGIGLHLAEAGAGEPLLLIHGWPQHWYAWRKVIPLLAGERRVICPDLRGFGWSDAPPGRYEKRTLARDMLALLDVLEIEQIDLIGHDWGAWVGYRLCLEHPERIRRYLALNIVTPWPDPPSARAALGLWRLLYQLAISTPRLGSWLISSTDLVKRMIAAGAYHRGVWTNADLDCFADVLRQPARTAASVQLYRTFLLRELAPYLAGADRRRRNRVPTLQLHGMRDLAIDHRRLGEWKLFSDEMALELRPDSGHFIAEELPELVAERALALFGGESPQAILAAAALQSAGGTSPSW